MEMYSNLNLSFLNFYKISVRKGSQNKKLWNFLFPIFFNCKITKTKWETNSNSSYKILFFCSISLIFIKIKDLSLIYLVIIYFLKF